MATSGSFNTTSYNGRYLTFEWERTNYSVEENYSEISWTLKGGGSAPYSFYTSAPFEVWIDDSLIWSSKILDPNKLKQNDDRTVTPTKEQFRQMSYEERVALKQSNEQAYKQLAKN